MGKNKNHSENKVREKSQYLQFSEYNRYSRAYALSLSFCPNPVLASASQFLKFTYRIDMSYDTNVASPTSQRLRFIASLLGRR